MSGPIPVTYATATKGSIGVYLDAIGTVTPTYTDQVTAQVTGVITQVHYREGQYVHKGDPLIDIDDRPYQAQLEQAQGALERDQNLLAEAQMDLKRYQEAWAKNAIPRQTLEDQEKLVAAGPGNGEERRGHGEVRPGAGGVLSYYFAYRRPCGTAAGGSGEPGDGQLDHAAGGGDADGADHRDLHSA